MGAGELWLAREGGLSDHPARLHRGPSWSGGLTNLIVNRAVVPDSALPNLLLPTDPGAGPTRSLNPEALEIPKNYLRPLSLPLATACSFVRFCGKATQYILCELFTDCQSWGESERETLDPTLLGKGSHSSVVTLLSSNRAGTLASHSTLCAASFTGRPQDHRSLSKAQPSGPPRS